MHRDIKPDNLLLDKDGRCTLADFGLTVWASTASVEDVVIQDVGGTLFYFAPEQHMGLQHNYKVDIWQLGCVWIEMFAGLKYSFSNYLPSGTHYEDRPMWMRDKLRTRIRDDLQDHPALDLVLAVSIFASGRPLHTPN